MDNLKMDINRSYFLKRALFLAYITIIYNIIEGVISVYFGVKNESVALFGFGADSIIETISASSIVIMIYRMQKNETENKSRFEKIALRITGSCFYLLAGLLSFEVVRNVISGRAPESTIPGIIITSLSIVFMLLIIRTKINIGKKLDSPAIIADARCGLVCVYMSIVVLVSSALFEIFHFGWFDALGTAGIVYFSIKEGKEAFDKAENKTCTCHDNGCN